MLDHSLWSFFINSQRKILKHFVKNNHEKKPKTSFDDEKKWIG